MSNIFLKKKGHKGHNKLSFLSNKHKILSKIGYTKYFLPAKEWYNNIYVYNKNYVKNLPRYDNMVIKLIKNFFDLHYVKNKYREKFSKRRLRIRLKRLSANRILVSKAEIKHTNTKAIITVYIYNAEKRYLINKLKNISFITRLSNKRTKKKVRKIKYKAFKLINLISKKFFTYNQNSLNKTNIFMCKHPLIWEKFIKKLLKKERLAYYYRYLLWFNKSKFQYTYLYPLNKLLSKFYDKNLEFNLINLKYLYLNSSILSQFLAIKIKKSSPLRVLNTFFNKVKIPKVKIWTSKVNYLNQNNQNFYNIYKYKYLYSFFSMKKTSKDSFKHKIFDLLNQLIQTRLTQQYLQHKHEKIVKKKKNYIDNINLLKNIELRSVSAVRLNLSGRLTRRFVAAKSITKKRYIGSLKNIDSSYKGLSSLMLRNQLKSNLQYTKLSSKRRIGSFGIKGWVSSF